MAPSKVLEGQLIDQEIETEIQNKNECESQKNQWCCTDVLINWLFFQSFELCSVFNVTNNIIQI